MITPICVENRQLFNPVLVFVLVVVAIGSWVEALREIQALRQEVVFRQQITTGLDELIQATDAIAAQH